MLVRVLIAFSFFNFAAISAASAADSDASRDTTAITAESNMLLGRAPMIGSFQNNSISDDSAPASRTGVFDQEKTIEIPTTLLEQIQNAVSGTTSIAENGAAQEFVAAERYGKIVLTAISKTLSRQDALKKPSLIPSVDKKVRSPFNDMSFEAFAPFAPMFDDSDNILFTVEDGAPWN